LTHRRGRGQDPCRGQQEMQGQALTGDRCCTTMLLVCWSLCGHRYLGRISHGWAPVWVQPHLSVQLHERTGSYVGAHAVSRAACTCSLQPGVVAQLSMRTAPAFTCPLSHHAPCTAVPAGPAGARTCPRPPAPGCPRAGLAETAHSDPPARAAASGTLMTSGMHQTGLQAVR